MAEVDAKGVPLLQARALVSVLGASSYVFCQEDQILHYHFPYRSLSSGTLQQASDSDIQRQSW